jgi:hypothetical protein
MYRPHLIAYGIILMSARLTRAAVSGLAGQEGIEPPTCGFGDRRSAN